MKKLLFGAVAIAALMTSCSKDDAKNAGSFTYDGKSYVTNYGVFSVYGTEETEILLTDKEITATSLADTTMRINGVDIALQLPAITPGTYTFYNRDVDTVEFDATKHFNYAAVAINYKLSSDEEAPEATKGTVTISKSGDNYAVSYSLEVGARKLVGSYNGPLKRAPNQ
ncbi:hypothetical protein [Chitinophaga tropicalis]|uniref:Uncharacterized protein n=1 Tax=Chitinophaga tropicalis TaxID=2683588 RepID=A0A7K1U3C3_9BACT|nr:hypothetical protein [Chitinophaga tropicalis]MVT08863.1 hypothetical protein [Chitinophaga tropicalis]